MRAFAALTELFSEPIKNAQTSFRRYDLTFENGKPVFTLSEVDRLYEFLEPPHGYCSGGPAQPSPTIGQCISGGLAPPISRYQ